MIVIRQPRRLRLITQSDHARVASEILSLWRADRLPDHPRRDDLLFAVREHDNGWRETDAAPRVNPATGDPYSFVDLPGKYRRELWDRGTRRYATERPTAAPLITRHALGLHQDRRGQEQWRVFLDLLAARLAEQLDATTHEPDSLDADYRWLRLADAISLRACGALGDRFEAADIRVQRTGTQLAIEPFPFAGATTFSIPCRHIPARPYLSDTDLTIELASAHWTEFKVRLVPPD